MLTPFALDNQGRKRPGTSNPGGALMEKLVHKRPSDQCTQRLIGLKNSFATGHDSVLFWVRWPQFYSTTHSDSEVIQAQYR